MARSCFSRNTRSLFSLFLAASLALNIPLDIMSTNAFEGKDASVDLDVSIVLDGGTLQEEQFSFELVPINAVFEEDRGGIPESEEDTEPEKDAIGTPSNAENNRKTQEDADGEIQEESGPSVMSVKVSKPIALIPAFDNFSTPSNGNALPPMPDDSSFAYNSEDGTVEFGTIFYNRAGIYRYKVKQADSHEKEIIYDKSVFDITVRVTADSKDALQARVLYEKNGIEVDSIRFRNSIRHTDKEAGQDGPGDHTDTTDESTEGPGESMEPQTATPANAEGFTVNGIPFPPMYEWVSDDGLLILNAVFSGDAHSDYDIKADTPLQFMVVQEEVQNDAAENSELTKLTMHLTADGNEILLDDCTATVQLKANTSFIVSRVQSESLISNTEDPFFEEEITGLENTEDITESSVSGIRVIVGEDEKGILAIAKETELEFNMANASDDIMLLSIHEDANPMFTIQHYLWFPHVAAETANDKWAIEFADTSQNKYGSSVTTHDVSAGGRLVQNGDTEDSLKSAGRLFSVNLVGSDRELKTELKLVPIFEDEESPYAKNPQIEYMNRVYDVNSSVKGNYVLTQIWVYQPEIDDTGEIVESDPYVGADGSIKADIPDDAFLIYRVPSSADPETDDGGNAPSDADYYPAKIKFTNNHSNVHLTIPEKEYAGVYADTGITGAAAEYLVHGSGTNAGMRVVKRPNSAVDSSGYTYTILIRKGTIVRLVFDTNKGYMERPANFYDYNIGDGKVYLSADAAKSQTGGQESSYAKSHYNTGLYMYTEKQGINSDSNYTGNGTKLAFGNNNTQTGRGNETWKGNTPNKANGSKSTQYKYATFGLAEGMDWSDGTMPAIIWSDGIADVNWFDSSNAVGKTAYPMSEGNYKLDFSRDGGVYTLAGVRHGSTVVAQGLEGFQNTANSIMSNEYWPMDDVGSTNGHDFLFGSAGNEANRKLSGSSGTSNAPISDGTYAGTSKRGTDKSAKHDHNSYFGMSYAVEFTLDPGYIAPLEYWFYGDDDLWVFIDSPDNPDFGQKLVADIGGVHSAIGEYVDLWDYVEPVPLDGEKQKYRLTIFYTERGASGSTCYMRFTVPMDSAYIPSDPRNGDIIIEKQEYDDNGELIKDGEPANMENRAIFEGMEAGQWPENMENIEESLANGDVRLNDGYFLFRVQMQKPDGTPYYDIYNYAIYNRSEVPDHTVDTDHSKCVEYGAIGDESGLDGDYYFALKSDEYIVISELPDGTEYKVKELSYLGYVTGWQSGRHTHENGDALNNLTIYKTMDEYLVFSIEENNFVRFTNSHALKAEPNPGDGETVPVGQEVVYEITWVNDSDEERDIIIRDRLDPGVDFVSAEFGDGEDWWVLTEEEQEQVRKGMAVEHSWPRDGNIIDTIRFDPNYQYVYDEGSGESAYVRDALEKQYGEPGPTVTWVRHGQAINTVGLVSLKVRVNGKATEKETEPGKFGTLDPRIENMSSVEVGNSNLVLTDGIENPTWAPEKTETGVEHWDGNIDEGFVLEEEPDGFTGPQIRPGDTISYRITWENYTNDEADIVIRDPLDENLSYVEGSAKAYRIDEPGSAVELPESAGILDGDNTLLWNINGQVPGSHGFVEFEATVQEEVRNASKVENTGYVRVGNMAEAETRPVQNKRILTLPNTGGTGTFAILFVAVMAVIAGMLVWNLSSKKRKPVAGE